MDSSPIHMHEIVNLGYGLKPKIYTDAIIFIKELPNIDFILSYHFHGDHFDQDAERELDTPLLIVTASHVAKQLRSKFSNIEKLEKRDTLTVVKGEVKVKIISTPSRHESLRISYYFLK